MKRISFFLALFVAVFAFGLVNAQVTENAIILDNTTGLTGTDTIGYNVTAQVQFNLRINIREDVGVLAGYTSGFTVYSPDGATWGLIDGSVNSDFSQAGGNFNVTSVNKWTTGAGADTIGFNGVSFGGGLVIPAGGYSGVAWAITMPTVNDGANDGLTICLDSTATFPPSLTWKWAAQGAAYAPSGDVFPTFSGPHCFTYAFIPNIPPSITNAPTDIEDLHCGVFEFDFDAADPENDLPYTFAVVSGPGTIDNDGVWSWNPGIGDVGNYVLEVAASDPVAGQGPVAQVNVIVNNQAPVITNCPVDVISAQTGVTRTTDLNATDGCSDVITWSIVGGTGAAEASVDAAGIVSFTPTVDGPYDVIVEATDGDMATTCTLNYLVSSGAPYQVVIEKDEGQTGFGALQGQFTTVDVTMLAADGPIGGFSFLMAYDASALSFSGANVDNSPFYQDCDWEYFTFRTGANGNCSGGCPSGLVSVTGIAETNDGPNHPTDLCETGILFSLEFLVSSDRNLECQYVPVRFFWVDCTDNTMSNWAGDTLIVSQAVYDYQNFDPQAPYSDNLANPNYGFPTYLGVQAECLVNPDPNKPSPYEGAGFFNGGVDIVCADDIDARGDINLDGVANTIADVVMFTNYFIYGTSAFTIIQGATFPIEAATAASDVNADGLTLTVADLVYLIRVVVGDAVAYPKTVPVDVSYTNANGVLTVNAPVAAAFVISEGAEPVLLADNMEFKTAEVDGQWRTIIYSTEANATFEGSFLDANGSISYIEMATYDGTPVRNLEMPTDYSVAQNYPNPFNPTTTIEFALPASSDVSVKIYNVTGQLVKQINGTFQTGTHSIEVDMTNQSSGVYFYKVSANDFSKTMKMVLLK
ncbi:T9SS type A sorting domain-containing protein [bacterium]|nr:T9SS type A sorting domain-containing protein [bacterium]